MASYYGSCMHHYFRPGTMINAPVSGPQLSALAEDELPKSVALSLLVGPGATGRLGRTLARVSRSPRYAGITLTVVYGAESAPKLRRLLEAYPAIRTVEADGSSRSELADAFLRDVLYQRRPLVCAISVPRPARVSRLLDEIAAQAHRVRHIGELTELPLLIPLDGTPDRLTGGYVAWLRERADDDDGPLTDYFGMLALRAAKPSFEAADPTGDELACQIWLHSEIPVGLDQPRWRVRLVLTPVSGAAITSVPVRPVARTDRRGRRHWDTVRARIPMGQVTSGTYECAIELATSDDSLRTHIPLAAREGLLLGARTTLMATGSSRTENLRYLFRGSPNSDACRLTVQIGSGVVARARWALSRVAEDLTLVRHWRATGGMAALRLLRLITVPLFAGRTVWMVAERPDTAQDNGFHLFQYLRSQEGRRDTYYVMDKTSPHFERVRRLGHVVSHSSWRHVLLMLHARVLADAYSIHHMLPRGWDAGQYARHLAGRVGALRVYLKHGVHLSPNAVKRGSAGYDVVLTVMPRETDAIRAVSGYDRQLAETGLPRYDALMPTEPSRTILFMSTWRRYLVPKLFGGVNHSQIPFEGSTYEVFIKQFLTSERLHRMLASFDYRLEFLPHYNLAQEIKKIKVAHDRIKILDAERVDFQGALRACDAFITDYSSVHFDAAYMGTPVIYTRFDEAEFEEQHAAPGWFNYDRDGFGPVARDLDSTLDLIEELLRGDCTMEAVYAERVRDSFTYRDQQNCARVVEAINAALGPSR